jgi:hypothetical protein
LLGSSLSLSGNGGFQYATLWFQGKNYAQTSLNGVSFLSLSDYSENPRDVKIKITVIATGCLNGKV